MFIVLLVLISFTGMFLRPPLMIAIIRSSITPLPYSTMDSDNAWHDKLRAIRYDENIGKWLLSTSEGFYRLQSLDTVPQSIKSAPPISPMGINVFEPYKDSLWLVGSFSGMFIWDVEKNITYDYFTNDVHKPSFGRPVAKDMDS